MYIEDPFTVVFDTKYDFNLDSFISWGALLFPEADENFYNKILPYLENTGLASLYLESTLVSNLFADEIARTRSGLIKGAFSILVTLIPLIALSVYLASVYCSAYEKEITVKRFQGYAFVQIHGKFIGVMSILYVLGIAIIFAGSLSKNHDVQSLGLTGIFGIAVPLISAILDFIILLFIIRLYERKSVASVIKGG